MTTSDEAAAFCHDHIQHPLMWCDEKRRLVERRNAEESLRMWRRRKAEEMARKEKDKQEYYELFVKHCPWGRPGGGAPNIDVRRKDITAVGLHSTAPITTTHRLTSLQPCRFSDYFAKHKRCLDPVAAYHPHYHHHHHQQQHHSVPRVTAHTHHAVQHISGDNARPMQASSTLTLCERDVGTAATSSGGNGGGATNTGAGGGVGIKSDGNKHAESLQITLKDHPSMSFRNKGHVDIEVRYKPNAATKGKPMLEKIVVTESDKCPLLLDHKNVKMVETKVMTTRPKKTLEKIEKPPSKDPWGKAGPGGKPWRSPKAVGSSFMKSLGWTNKQMLKDLDQDNPATPAEKPTFRKSRASRKLTRCCDVCTCTCPAMILNTSPLKPIQKQTNTNAMKEQKPKICPRLLRHNKTIDTTTDNSANMKGGGGGGNKTATMADNNGVELVPLLARRRAFERPISLSTTDVTKRTASNDRLHTAAAAADVATTDMRYLHDLNCQVAQKRRSISVAQQLDRDECNQHFMVFDTFWGRPGHGAPPVLTNRKLKLDNLLYGTPGCNSE
ncbi:hypothetical protein FF38_11659 [Lucilia cuprina]|uniref:Uncharacterized protein n=1 Tax=Lucilia cuprina TaxID=7375 RepID=A0A0L0CEL7_LUCCU|nr:hypothetical protein FF38_11659 [Lucilia cuprina]